MVLANTERCNNVLVAKKRERPYIETLRAGLNQVLAYVSKEEQKEHLK